MDRVCRHCKEPFSDRAGRGLCRSCWNDKSIRDRYPPVAAFGGKDAWKEQRKALKAGTSRLDVAEGSQEQEQAVRIASRLRNDLFERLADEHGIKRPACGNGGVPSVIADEFDEAESTIAITLARLIERHLVRESLLKARSVPA